MRPYTILLTLLFTLSLSSHSLNQVIYSNSFESPEDSAVWEGFINLNNDVPINGGAKSAYVSGGCVVPHAWIELGPFNTGGFYKLKCWGKNLGTGGTVSIEPAGLRDYPKQLYIGINQNEWTYYESSESLYCPPYVKIILSMSAGGFVPSAMLIDNIEVIKIQTGNTGWVLQNSGTTESLKDVTMLDSVTAVAVGNGTTILKTTDSGITWRNVAPQIDCNNGTDCLINWNAVVFFDQLNGLVAGESALMITSDGGEEWHFLNAPSGNNFLSIADAGLYNIFIGDDSGYVYNSLDTGKTWTSEKLADLPIVSVYPVLHNPLILGLYVLEIFALTPNSLFIKSGIEPWHEWGSLEFFQGLGSAAFKGGFSENETHFIVGVQGDFVPQSTIIRLRPQDSHWYSVGPPNEIGELRGLAIPKIPEVYLCIYPVPSAVYACGSGGKILKSTNNGDYWISLTAPTTQNLNSINFYDWDTGFAVGDSGTILYTSTGGISPANGTPSPFNLVFPPDEDIRPVPRSIGFIWNKSADPDGNPVEYTVLISEDSCASWKSYGPTQDTSLQIHSPAQIPGRYFWMVIANDGMLAAPSTRIFTFTINTLSDADENVTNAPEDFFLQQNYPNPFNPSTKIRYELPEASYVSLVIFNSIGEKVDELVNGFQAAGKYEVEWKAEGYTGGIYFCSIKAGNFSATRKLILLK